MKALGRMRLTRWLVLAAAWRTACADDAAAASPAPGPAASSAESAGAASELTPVKKVFKEVKQEEEQLEQKLAPVEKAMSELYKGLQAPDYNARPTLEGNDPLLINASVIVVVCSIVAAIASGAAADAFCRCKAMEGRPRLWAVFLIFLSYLLLIPALCSELLSFAIIVNVIGHRIRVHPRAENPSCTESTPGLVELLYDTGGKTGAVLIVLFAMVVPAVEALMLMLGEFFRFRNCPCCNKAARAVIIWVQHRSKWASPDMFAYTLLVHLVRSLDHDPLILTDARLDVGFACFCAFCVCATAASLGFPLPQLSASPDEGRSGLGLCDDSASPPLAVRCIGVQGVQWLATVLALLFAGLMAAGLTIPCMALRINERPLYKPVGPLPTQAKAVVDGLAIPEMLSTDVSLWMCMKKLLEWTQQGEATSYVALTMWAVFVVGFSFCDMLLLTVSAWRLQKDARDKEDGPSWLCRAIDAARVVRKLSMLDVAIVGIFLVTYCMAIYEKIGVIVSAQRGILFLFAAEVVHVLVYHAVSTAADYADACMADGDGSPAANGQPASLACCVSTKRIQWQLGIAPRGGAYERFEPASARAT